MPISGLTQITVTGTYQNMQGTGLNGTVTFTPTASIIDASGKIVIPQNGIVTPVANGAFSITIPTTDNSALSPSGWAWNISVSVPGVTGTQSNFTVFLPSALGSTVDVSALTPASGLFPAPVSILNSNNTWSGTNTFSAPTTFNASATFTAPVTLPGGYLSLLATNGTAGTVLINGSQTISSWTAPSDGNLHRVLVFGIQDVSSGETGGAVNASLTMPDGNAYSPQIFGGNAGLGGHNMSFTVYLIKSGSVFAVVQTGALSAGAATLWVELWGA